MKLVVVRVSLFSIRESERRILSNSKCAHLGNADHKWSGRMCWRREEVWQANTFSKRKRIKGWVAQREEPSFGSKRPLRKEERVVVVSGAQSPSVHDGGGSRTGMGSIL